MFISFSALRGLMASVVTESKEVGQESECTSLRFTKEERPETKLSRTAIAYLHISKCVVAVITVILLVIVMKCQGLYTKDIYWPGISDTSRANPGYGIMIIGFFYASVVMYFTKRYIHYEFLLPLINKYAKGDQKAFALAEWTYTLNRWIPWALCGIAAFDVGSWPWIHYGAAGIWFLFSTAIELVKAKLYHRLLKNELPAKHAKVLRKSMWIRLILVGIAVPFFLMNLYPANIRLLTYAEAKLRLEPTNPGLADQCKLWKSSEPYNWRRTDGRKLSDPYDNYHLGLFEKIPVNEMCDTGERYYHTTILSFDHCVFEGWLWSVWELVAIIALAIAAAWSGPDLLSFGDSLRDD